MAQDFTCTTLDMVRAEASRIWASNDKFMTSIRPQVEVAKRVISKQTARIESVLGDGNCNDAKVWWYDACGSEPVDNTADCNISGGDTVSTSCKTYGYTVEKMAKLTVNDAEFCGNDAGFEEAIAKGFLKMATNLDNQIEKFVINALDGFAGTNKYTSDDRGDVVGTTTFVGAPYWGAGLMSYFAKVAMVNKMENSSMFSGENMFDVVYNAGADSDNANGKGDANKLSAFDWGFDLFNMDTLLGAKKTLMVSPDAVAFSSWNKFKQRDAINNGANIERFTFNSPNLDGVVYDVVY